MAGWLDRAASLIFVISNQSYSCQNQVTSHHVRGSVHKGMLVAPPLVQRAVINMISFKLQCSNKLRGSSCSSNCQYEIHRRRLQRICVEMSSQTSLSRNELLIPGHIHVTDDFNSFFRILAAFQRFLYIHSNMPNKTPLELYSARDLQTTHIPEVSLHCCILISGNRCSQYEIAALRLALHMGEKPHMDIFVHALAMNQHFPDPGNNTMWTNTSGLVHL